jgi:hypothetical protein
VTRNDDEPTRTATRRFGTVAKWVWPLVVGAIVGLAYTYLAYRFGWYGISSGA